jgi:hypothetical protein
MKVSFSSFIQAALEVEGAKTTSLCPDAKLIQLVIPPLPAYLHENNVFVLCSNEELVTNIYC